MPLDSSTVITPSLPTFSMASETNSPMAVLFAEMDATWEMAALVSIFLALDLIASTTLSTAFSIPSLTIMGLAPAATFFMPSRTIAWAKTAAVVVPSPATSFVFVATSLTSWAPMFSSGSLNSISRAMVTPSLIIMGEPNFFSSTTLRPLGPSVTRTVSARALTPFSNARLASSRKTISFPANFSYLLNYFTITPRMSVSRIIRYSTSSSLISLPAYLEKSILSPT